MCQNLVHFNVSCSLGAHNKLLSLKNRLNLPKFDFTGGCEDARETVDGGHRPNIICHAIMHPCAKIWSISTCLVPRVLIASSCHSKTD
jgi:hypothetical protein